MIPSHGPAAAFRWLLDAIELLRRQPVVLFRAGLVLVAVALLPSLLQRLVSAGGGAMQLLPTLLGLLLMPPVLGGFFRLLRAVDRGEPTTTGVLGSVLRDPRTASRLVLCNLLYAVMTVALLVALAYALGGPALFDYLRALSSLKPNATPADLPPLPDGALLLVVVMLLVALFVTTAQQLAAARIALEDGRVLGASGFGAMATLRNALPFLVLYAPLLLGAVFAFGIFGLVATLVFMALSLVSTGLGLFVVGLLLFAVLAGAYALMLAFFYIAWRDLSGQLAALPRAPGDLPPPTQVIAA